MDFKDQITQLAERIEKLRDNIATEEATKTAFVLPLISALGYDIFNPLEVVPELDCDIARKKGEKIDYAILKDDVPVILMECKYWQQDLDLHNTQLKRYFVSSNARFGVLTNGIEYRFYADLEKPNVMDEKPFLVVNLLELSDSDIEQMKKFHKSYFNESDILSTAQELKYTLELRNVLTQEIDSPEPEFVRFFIKKIEENKTVTQRVIEQFTPLIKKAFNGIINERITERLGRAIKSEEDDEQNKPDSTASQSRYIEQNFDNIDVDGDEESRTATQDELDSFYVVKSIIREVIDPKRLTYRKLQYYVRIMIDDNTRQSLCILRFSKRKKYVDFHKDECWTGIIPINSVDDIYNYASELKQMATQYK